MQKLINTWRHPAKTTTNATSPFRNCRVVPSFSFIFTCHSQILVLSLQHSYKDDYYTFDTLFVANQPFEPFSELWDKVEEIPAEVFQQALERYDNSIREILSMDFEKTPLRRRRDIDEYYYTINKKNGKAIFGRVIDEYSTEQITVYPSGYSFNSCICNTDYMPAKARYYSIDPMTFQKVQKMHDVLNSTLLTLINSYLE